MKSLRLRRMLVVSPTEQKGRELTFDEDLTVLLGPNNAGKSSLVKTLYMTFGAQPAKVNGDWLRLAVHSLVHFDVEETQFTMVHADGTYGLFSNGELIVSTS